MQSIDPFSRLDELEAGQPESQTVMARFRTRFHKQVIFSRFSTNPRKSLEEVIASVAIDEPAGFLPFPWPENAITNGREMTKAALIKMRTIVNVGLRMTAASTTAMTSLINERYPEWTLVTAAPGNLCSCEVCVLQNGQVVYSIQNQLDRDVPKSLRPREGAWKGFVEAMIILELVS